MAVMVINGVNFPDREIADFCRRSGIRMLSVFGSILGGEFKPESDVDLLVEFLPGQTPGLIRFSRMEADLSELLGRTVDLRTSADLSKYFRDEVVARARPLHAA